MMTGKYMRPLLALGRRATTRRRGPATLRRYGYRTAAFYPPAVFFIDEPNASRRSRTRGARLRVPQGGVRVAGAPRAAGRELPRASAGGPAALRVGAPLRAARALRGPPRAPLRRRRVADLDAYDSEIAAADAGLGAIVDAVRAKRPGAVVVVTRRPRRGVRRARRPLPRHHRLRRAGARAARGRRRRASRRARVDAPVQTIDLLPTALSALGVPRPARVRGRGSRAARSPGQGAPGRAGFAFAETDDHTLLARGGRSAGVRAQDRRRARSTTSRAIRARRATSRASAGRRRARAAPGDARRSSARHGRYEAGQGAGLPEALRRGLAGRRRRRGRRRRAPRRRERRPSGARPPRCSSACTPRAPRRSSRRALARGRGRRRAALVRARARRGPRGAPNAARPPRSSRDPTSRGGGARRSRSPSGAMRAGRRSSSRSGPRGAARGGARVRGQRGSSSRALAKVAREGAAPVLVALARRRAPAPVRSPTRSASSAILRAQAAAPRRVRARALRLRAPARGARARARSARGDELFAPLAALRRRAASRWPTRSRSRESALLARAAPAAGIAPASPASLVEGTVTVTGRARAPARARARRRGAARGGRRAIRRTSRRDRDALLRRRDGRIARGRGAASRTTAGILGALDRRAAPRSCPLRRRRRGTAGPTSLVDGKSPRDRVPSEAGARRVRTRKDREKRGRDRGGRAPAGEGEAAGRRSEAPGDAEAAKEPEDDAVPRGDRAPRRRPRRRGRDREARARARSRSSPSAARRRRGKKGGLEAAASKRLAQDRRERASRSA